MSGRGKHPNSIEWVYRRRQYLRGDPDYHRFWWHTAANQWGRLPPDEASEPVERLDPAWPVSVKSSPAWVEEDWLAFLDKAEAAAFRDNAKYGKNKRPRPHKNSGWAAGLSEGVRRGAIAPVRDLYPHTNRDELEANRRNLARMLACIRRGDSPTKPLPSPKCDPLPQDWSTNYQPPLLDAEARADG